MSCPWFVSLVRVPELLDTIRVPKGHELRDTNRVVSLESCRVPESCPWESLRDTNSKKIVSLDLRDTIKGHDTIFVSLIVSLSCPLIVSLVRVPELLDLICVPESP